MFGKSFIDHFSTILIILYFVLMSLAKDPDSSQDPYKKLRPN
jgi:hypothetical protein